MDTCFRTPDKGAKSAPAKIHQTKSDLLISVSSRKCLFPDKSEDDEIDKGKQSVEAYLQPSSFYGNSVPISKSSFGVSSLKNYRSPTKKAYKSRISLFNEGCSSTKRRSFSKSSARRPSHKRPKSEIHTGVSHSIKQRKPVVGAKKKSTPSRKESPRSGSDSSPSSTRFSAPRTPVTSRQSLPESPAKSDNIFFDEVVYTTRKTPKTKKRNSGVDSPYPWSLKFTKAERGEVLSDGGESATKKRKFFKSQKSPVSAYSVVLPAPGAKRRKLLDLEQDSTANFKQVEGQTTSASDILDLIEEGRVIEEDTDEEACKENVSRIIGRLEEEEEEDAESGGSGGIKVIDITQTTGNLSITDTPPRQRSVCRTPDKTLGVTPLDGSPRRSPRIRTPTKFFSVFNKDSPKLSDITNWSAVKSALLKKDAKKSGAQTPTPNRWRPISENQYQIDAGQRRFGEKQCPTCCLVYQVGDPDDEIEHVKYHNNYKLFTFLGWQNERVVRRFGVDRVVMVVPSDQKSWWERVTRILEVIDEELGYPAEEFNPDLKFLMYISNKKIIGVVAALPVKKAYRMLMSDTDIDMCSEESYPVKCSVTRIWTDSYNRKTGVATKLMDCLRACFVPGEYLKLDDVAFSVPTVDGRIFAKKYTKRDDYLIYTGW